MKTMNITENTDDYKINIRYSKTNNFYMVELVYGRFVRPVATVHPLNRIDKILGRTIESKLCSAIDEANKTIIRLSEDQKKADDILTKLKTHFDYKNNQQG